MTLPTKINGSKSKPPPVLVKPKLPTPIVDFIRANGFPEKAALLEEDARGNAKLRIFGVSGTVIVEGVPYSPTKRRGFWSHLGRKP
jgi:hypothetical protein